MFDVATLLGAGGGAVVAHCAVVTVMLTQLETPEALRDRTPSV
jgi:hypothetical protein